MKNVLRSFYLSMTFLMFLLGFSTTSFAQVQLPIGTILGEVDPRNPIIECVLRCQGIANTEFWELERQYWARKPEDRDIIEHIEIWERFNLRYEACIGVCSLPDIQ
ncbi:hypothetical protein OAO01_04755 [Oligoflexia bacterium]|nr:hypothetical protein [Oligoflexia bacterium]